MSIQQEFRQLSNPQNALGASRFFKTGPGEYGEGDQFLGITIPTIRSFLKAYRNLPLAEISHLIQSPFHEERILALLILVEQFKKGSPTEQAKLHQFYLANTAKINNWDLVDCSAEYLVGAFLYQQMPLSTPKLLVELANSANLWQNRIAILATFYYLKQGQTTPTKEIANILLQHPHDLIHKAVGWMLREMGKRCSEQQLKSYLDQHASKMPRTCLRYAIERLPENQRQFYLSSSRTAA